jgi:hypothetical protein
VSDSELCCVFNEYVFFCPVTLKSETRIAQFKVEFPRITLNMNKDNLKAQRFNEKY